MNLQACPHWSRYAVRQIGEDYYILFQCDSPAPGPEEHGRGDLPRAEKCLLGYKDGLWITEPVIGFTVFADGHYSNERESFSYGYVRHFWQGVRKRDSTQWPEALAAFHAWCDTLEEQCLAVERP